MEPEEIQNITENVVDAVEANENILYIIVAIMIAAGPRIYKILKKRLTKNIDDKVKAIADEVTKPIKEISEILKEQQEFQVEAHKVWMEEFRSMQDRQDRLEANQEEMKGTLDSHHDRLEELEP